MSFIPMFIFYEGRKYENNDLGMIFEGKTRTIEIDRDTSFTTLKRRIHGKLELQRNQIVSSITARYFLFNGKYRGAAIMDDEDVKFMFSFAEKCGTNVAEVYVDTEYVGSSSTSLRIEDLNITPTYIADVEEAHTDDYEDVHGDDVMHLDNDAVHGNLEDDVYESEEDEYVEEGQIPHGCSLDSDTDDESDSNPLANEVTTTSNVPNQVSFWNDCSHYTYINWEHPDQEVDVDVRDAEAGWQVGDELYIGQQFDNKEAVQMAIKYYCMKIRQTATVVESKPTGLHVKCPKYKEGCPWRVRASLPKRENRWVISKWGGRHTCVNAYMSQDHRQLDSDFICAAIIGMCVVYFISFNFVV